MKKIGVLALQGAYQKHCDILSMLNVESSLIRNSDELNECSALIIPGGESTTISLLIQQHGLYDAIKSFAENHGVMGVCAGLIMMASHVDDKRIKPLELIACRILRNHYGRQTHSFSAEIKLNFSEDTYHAHFIRAPGITELPAETSILATYSDEAVMIGKGKHIGLSFHPELTDDTRIHEYWLRQL